MLIAAWNFGVMLILTCYYILYLLFSLCLLNTWGFEMLRLLVDLMVSSLELRGSYYAYGLNRVGLDQVLGVEPKESRVPSRKLRIASCAV